MRRKKLRGKYTDIKVSSLKKFISKNKLKLITISSFLVVLGTILLINSQKDNIFKSSYKKLLANNGIYTEEIKSIDITSDDYDEPGSFKVTKKAEWTDYGKAKLTINADSIIKPKNNNKKDIILVIDTSFSMYGEKLDKVKEDAIDLTNYMLADNKNNIGVITFDTNAQILQRPTNNIYDIVDVINSINAYGNTNYNEALKNVDLILDNYSVKDNRDLVILFLTDGYPCEDASMHKSTYQILKGKYPTSIISGIQYEMGPKVIGALKEVSDIQYIADMDSLENILIEAVLNPVIYSEFVITDFIDTDYFEEPINEDIKVSIGSYELDGNKITWNLGDSYITGNNATLTVNLTQKEEYLEEEGIYPTNEKESIKYKLGEKNETISSHDTPALKNKYELIYNVNAPEGCNLNEIESEKQPVNKVITINAQELSCSGYNFKGWEVEHSQDIKFISKKSFKMPTRDVYINATWSKQSINKSMDGTIREKPTLYKVLENEAKSKSGLAKQYTGDHGDALDRSGTKNIYHYYSNSSTMSNSILNKNNVIFGGYCWHMIRTTDTGGVKLLYDGEVENGMCLDNRGKHLGFGYPSYSNLSSPYYYGTEFEYNPDSPNKFKLTGDVELMTWSDETASNIIGKYTCLSNSADAECSDMYLIVSYKSNTEAYRHYLSTSMKYFTIGNTEFDLKSGSPAYGSYMYGNAYPTYKTEGIIKESYNKSGTFFTTTSINTNFWYADSFNFNDNKFSLSNPYKLTSADNYSDLVGKYTLNNRSSTYSNSEIMYITDVNDNTIWYKKVYAGDDLDNIPYIVMGDSIVENTDGTYTLQNVKKVTFSDWRENYENYNNYYYCGDNKTSCASPRLITSVYSSFCFYLNATEKIMLGKSRESDNLVDTILVSKEELYRNYSNYSDYKYTCNTASSECTNNSIRAIKEFSPSNYAYATKRYYANSVTWNGEKYVLNNPQEMETIMDTTLLSSNHYTCLNPDETECSEVAFIYQFTNNYLYYVLFSSGKEKNIDDVLSSMFENNVNDASIKIAVDAWFKKYLNNYSNYLEDTVFCVDRNFQRKGGWNENGNITDLLLFEGYTQTNINCVKDTDRFTTQNEKAKLNYKVGLLTSAEENLLNYTSLQNMNTDSNYYLLNPFYYTENSMHSFELHDGCGMTSCMRLHGDSGIRPAISLKPNIEYSDGDGSKEHPYIIDMEDD